MAKYDRVRERTGWGLPGQTSTCSTQADVDELLDLTRDGDPRVRKVALANLCPCHVRANFPAAWDRIMEMVDDPDPLVRRSVVHTLADGSPREREGEVVEALTALRNDPDRKVRRQVNHVLGEYRRTGRVNVL